MAASKCSGDESLPALFWDTIPDNAEEHADYAGIQALIHDESTPEETAENFKNQGNQRVARAKQVKNKVYFHEAISYYTKGINVQCGNQRLCSILYGNRAQAQLFLGNSQKALEDSKQAITIDNSNLKAYYRGAQSALNLHKVDIAQQFCKEGLELDPTNTELQNLLKESIKCQSVLEKQHAAEELKQKSLIEKATKMADNLLRRDVRLCQPNFKVGRFQPHLDDEDVLHWPVLFVYPETMQQDIIQDVAETHTLEDHLDVMFAPDAEPISWDKDHEYRRDTVIVYYLANAGRPFPRDEMIQVLAGQYTGDISEHAPTKYGEHAISWVGVEEWKTIRDILGEPGHIVPGVPTFYILAKGSKYQKIFLSSSEISFQ